MLHNNNSFALLGHSQYNIQETAYNVKADDTLRVDWAQFLEYYVLNQNVDPKLVPYLTL